MKTSRMLAFAVGLLAVGLLLGCCKPKASMESEMLSFAFLAADNAGVLSADVAATIDGADVTVEVPTGTDVTGLVPAITVSAGATVSPASGVSRDFTLPVGYTVTAEDGISFTVYTVTVTVAGSTGDTTPPVAGASGALTLVAADSTTVSVSWSEATDDTDDAADLQYKVVWSDSVSDDIGSVADAEANGTVARDWGAWVASFDVTGLTPGATCWFNVLVKDTSGNKAAYVASQVTLPSMAMITGSSWAADGYAGWATALSGDGKTLVVGAPGSPSSKGAAYVFEKGATGWTLAATLSATLAPLASSTNDQFGYSVAIDDDGSVVVVGAPWADGGETDTGAVYVYERPVDGWSGVAAAGAEYATIDYDSYNIGWSVSVSADGSVVAAGATGDASGGGLGEVAVLVRSGAAWSGGFDVGGALIHLVSSAPEANARLGYSVSMSSDGTVIAAGAPWADAGGTDRGAVYVFVRSTAWISDTEDALLTRSAGSNSDLLGAVVAISPDGAVIAAQARGADSEAGAVFIYDRGLGWASGTEDSALPAPADLVAYDSLGSALSFSGSASLLAAGARGNTVGTSALQGSVYLYSRGTLGYGSPVEYVQSSGGADNDQFGTSVSLSGDGKRLIAGAPGVDAVDADAGAVFVFDR